MTNLSCAAGLFSTQCAYNEPAGTYGLNLLISIAINLIEDDAFIPFTWYIEYVQ